MNKKDRETLDLITRCFNTLFEEMREMYTAGEESIENRILSTRDSVNKALKLFWNNDCMIAMQYMDRVESLKDLSEVYLDTDYLKELLDPINDMELSHATQLADMLMYGIVRNARRGILGDSEKSKNRLKLYLTAYQLFGQEKELTEFPFDFIDLNVKHETP